jgi:hypothetical protein
VFFLPNEVPKRIAGIIVEAAGRSAHVRGRNE